MEKEQTAIVDVGYLRERIRAAGLRGTGSRVTVLRVLEEARAPMTHGEISQLLRSAGYDQATVYRNLMDLSRVGLLERSDLGDHAWRFEVRQGSGQHKGQHPHFVCVDCGAVDCLPEQAVSVRDTPGAPRALQRRDTAIQIQGRCDSCEQRAAGHAET